MSMTVLDLKLRCLELALAANPVSVSSFSTSEPNGDNIVETAKKFEKYCSEEIKGLTTPVKK